MRSVGGQTLSLDGRRGRTDGLVVEPFLFLIAQAARPLEPAARFRLGAIDEVALGRGSRRRAEAADRTLRVVIADGWMSSEHARLTRDGDTWRLADRGSKNGTMVNGQRQREAILFDGDLIELGQTFLVFRDGLATAPGAPACLDASQLDALPGLATLIPDLARRYDQLARLAASKTSLVLHGPSGSGKEMLAGAVHALSGRRGPFVPVNCAALPEGLVESELFGHVKGAFSGADRDREGLIAASRGGTLLLDEIGDLPAAAQSKLLRALQEQEVRPVGATEPVRVDLRVVAATHRDLARLVADGQFREDLLARLGGVFAVPPLCDRREDLGLIVAALLGRIEDPRATRVGFTTQALRAILRYSWPRNVRELHKALERAIALADGGDIDCDHLPDEVVDALAARPRPSSATPIPTPPPLSDDDLARRDQLVALLREHDGNIAAVARAMGRVRSQIQRWMKRYGIE
jgi:sigma-54 dependent transcriptional regulator, acetoin dehydrogenase operon transcriptional activator AcoR